MSVFYKIIKYVPALQTLGSFIATLHLQKNILKTPINTERDKAKQ